MVTDTADMPMERAAQRFHQIAAIERLIVLKLTEVAACKDHLKELNEGYTGLLLRLREAARNEGDLPLFAGLDDLPSN